MNVLDDFYTRISHYLQEKADPKPYTEWLQENTKLAGLPFSVSKYPFQRQILNDMHTNLCCVKPSQVGLALALDTPILTERGWSTMGKLKVGDLIYEGSGSGELTEVTYLSPIYLDHECFQLQFDHDTQVVADAGHRWPVSVKGGKVEIRTTLEMYQEKYLFGSKMTVKGGLSGQLSFTLTGIFKVPAVPVRCLTVAHPSHLFLCSKSLIATHNTEVQIRKALAIAARNPHRTVMFTLPTDDMRKRLYQTRVENLIKNTPIFNPMGQKPSRSIEISQILESYVLMVPVTEAAATSQPADVVFNDEVDLSNQSLLALFNSRMQGSNWRMSQRFSTPTYEGFGISEDFALSDQHHYMYKCSKCGHHQTPEFNRKFVTVPKLPEDLSGDYSLFENDWIDKYGLEMNSAFLHCEICRTPMNLKNHDGREWVAKYPNRTHHRGYRVSPFSVSTLPPSYIFNQLFTYRRNDNLKGWYNTVLGLPYEGGDERLSRRDILACFSEMIHPLEYDSNWHYFLGADMGNLCHITVARSRNGTEMQVVLMEVVGSSAYVDRLLVLKDTYHIDLGFSDRFPLTETVNRVRELSENTFIPLQYQHSKGAEKFRYHDDELGNLSHASAQRTWHLDQIVTKVRNQKVTFAGYGGQRELIIEHLRDMVREAKDEEVPVWKKLNGKDHYFHSLGYCHQAMLQFFDGKNSSMNSNTTLYLGGIDVKFPASNTMGLFGNMGNLKRRGGGNGGNLF